MKRFKTVVVNGRTFEILEDTGETLQDVAIWLSEALEQKSYYIAQAASFREQAQSERKKANEFVSTIFQKKKYNRQKQHDEKNGVQRFISRMEPLESYDLDMMQEEKELYQTRANELHRQSDEFMSLANEQDDRIKKYKRQIEELKEVDRGSQA